ncbi:hypothetical protein VCHENC02_3010 [Vibrio harveyi]|uniref:Uncharacterized protein n=1 Tax=Vibrio harveyi TaxID=669 RepID=A0A454CY73_VIBHA|nr:hypothetical protein VCHENC02_3010 [Vibrio harveyi]
MLAWLGFEGSVEPSQKLATNTLRCFLCSRVNDNGLNHAS